MGSDSVRIPDEEASSDLKSVAWAKTSTKPRVGGNDDLPQQPAGRDKPMTSREPMDQLAGGLHFIDGTNTIGSRVDLPVAAFGVQKRCKILCEISI